MDILIYLYYIQRSLLGKYNTANVQILGGGSNKRDLVETSLAVIRFITYYSRTPSLHNVYATQVFPVSE